MFLHIGGDFVVLKKDVIAIIDLEKSTISEDTKNFLRISEEEGFIIAISDDMPKTFIITEAQGKSKIYISPISSATIYKRYMLN